MSKGTKFGATTDLTATCERVGCGQTFSPKNNRHKFCSDRCRKLADRESEAFKARQYTRSVQQHERRIQHQHRRRVFTPAQETKDFIQGGVPRAAPRQFPDASPEAIERFENARRLKEEEEQ